MTLCGLFVARGVRLWILARLFVVVGVAFAAMSGGRAAGIEPAALLLLAPPAALLVVPLTAMLGLADVARRGERALLGNLGVSRRRVAVWFAAPAVVGELLLAAATPLVIAASR